MLFLSIYIKECVYKNILKRYYETDTIIRFMYCYLIVIKVNYYY